ncbi:hypothetical protein D3C78_1635380 [compost metagenome]
MVVHRNRQGFLRLFLADDVLVQAGADFLRRRQLGRHLFRRGRIAQLGFQLFVNDVGTQVDTFIANVDLWPGDQTLHFVLALAAERAVKQFFAVFISHSHHSRIRQPLRHAKSALCRSDRKPAPAPRT